MKMFPAFGSLREKVLDGIFLALQGQEQAAALATVSWGHRDRPTPRTFQSYEGYVGQLPL